MCSRNDLSEHIRLALARRELALWSVIGVGCAVWVVMLWLLVGWWLA